MGIAHATPHHRGRARPLEHRTDCTIRPGAPCGSPYKILSFGTSALFLPVLALLLLAACAGPTLPDGQEATPEAWAAFMDSGSNARTDADWNDIDAAVAAGASRVEMAVVSANEGPTRAGAPGDTRERIFTLKTIRDEPAWVTITKAASAPASADPSPLEDASATRVAGSDGAEALLLRAKVGRFGDRQRETALLQSISRRLTQLKGRDSAPLD